MIIGVGQVSYDEPQVDTPFDAIDIMTDAVSTAVADAGRPNMAEAIDTISVVAGLFSFQNPAALIAGQLGIRDVHTVLTSMGGNTPIAFVGELGSRIWRGDADVVVLVGGENNATRRALKKQGRRVTRRDDTATGPHEAWGPALDMGSATDIERGGEFPRNTYAVMDSALRAHRGETLDRARDRAAQLWAGFASVAAQNPHAADRTAMTADEIRNPSPTNRMVSWPYTKAMCANNHVDQAAAIIVASSEAADRLGVPLDRRVFIHDTLSTVDTDSILPRRELHRSSALELAATEVGNRWGPMSDVEHLDFYGCFPAVVSHSCDVFGVSADRQLTVTGGLGFAGAPLNFAAGQSLVAMVEVLRADPAARGVVQGNGGHASKHSFGLYSTQPPMAYHAPTLSYDQSPIIEPAGPGRHGPVVVDGVTVEHGPEGPLRAVLACRFEDGARTWANSIDAAVMQAIETEETVGAAGSVSAGQFSF